MLLADLLSECYAVEFDEVWERERTATPVRVFAVRLHSTGCSLRETQVILRLIGVERTHQAIWHWIHRLANSVLDPPTASPSRVAVDETAVKINGDWSWVYTAIYLDSQLLLDVAVFGRRGTDPAAAFLYRLNEKHDLDDTVFLIDGYGYLTSLFRLGLSGQLDYVERNLIEKWFHTLKIRVDHFHNSWVDSQSSVRECLEHFIHYYNTQRPHQSLNGQTPARVSN
ncbi:IS6 family transposase [Natronorubrum aibiense]|uniref:IS6 family transposase n=1 Tax=Natronorubrum aibiense TaxID=348826 RepID=A0A5P9P8F2_9EURY|nr:IS6 family transposase [Natronorubrum aibiense]QFU84441.1 IS6 family transposase [Natronorubrum aibiense]